MGEPQDKCPECGAEVQEERVSCAQCGTDYPWIDMSDTATSTPGK
jgi:endogenous inhibitor of DNA gyrase (YacG/DUF329 family)